MVGAANNRVKKVTLIDQIDELYFKYKTMKYFNSNKEEK